MQVLLEANFQGHTNSSPLHRKMEVYENTKIIQGQDTFAFSLMNQMFPGSSVQWIAYWSKKSFEKKDKYTEYSTYY